MPAKKKYFSEEERKAAQRESYKRYNSSMKGSIRKEKFMESYEYDPSKQKEYSDKYFKNMTEEEATEYRLKNRIKMAKSRKENPERHMVNDARKRAKEKGLEFSITADDISIPDICPVLRIPLFSGQSKWCDNSPSLDRIDNLKGYTKENIAVISLRANQLKNDGTLEELKLIVEYMEKNLDLVR